MLRTRQVAVVVSIAVVSFLIGTSVATEGGNPFDQIWDAFNGLESRVETLEEQSIPQGFVTAPAYDTGWTNFGGSGGNLYVEHNLNTRDILVYMGYANRSQSAGWTYRDLNTIQIHRDTINIHYLLRVMIWRIPDSPT